jgi:hypothetical protein
MKAVLASILLLFPLTHLHAQDNYPLPAGKPDTWRIPGQSERLTVPQETKTASGEQIEVPPPPGNEAIEGPTGPSGQAEEEYTGTREGLGGTAGTGITQFGTEENR